MLLLEGGRVVSPLDHTDAILDVLIDPGKGEVVAVGEALSADPRAAGASRVDCRGAVVAPGGVDLSSDLCDPGFTWREDLRSGSEAAAAGGYAHVVASPRTEPVVDSPAVLRDVLRRAEGLPGARIHQAGALTVALEGEALAEVGLLQEAGAVAVSDGSVSVRDTGVLRRSLEYTRPFGLTVLLRPQDAALAAGGVMHEGRVSLRIGLRGEPAEAEEVGIQRLVCLTRLTGARVHLTHVTTARGVQMVRSAQDEGLPLTATTPARHLVLTDADIERSGYDTALRVSPPLRPDADRMALIAALKDGTLAGVIADHVPWTRVGKELEFSWAQPGAQGFSTALPAVLTALEGDPVAAVRALSVGPAAVLGWSPRVRPGAAADLMVFEPDGEHEVPAPPHSRGCNEPLRGRTLRGRIRAVVVSGRLAHGPITD